MRFCRYGSLLVLAAVLSRPSPATAQPQSVAPASRSLPTDPPDADSLSAEGRPKIVLDYLELPADVAAAAQTRKQLKTILYRETRRVRWGAGTGSTITYRFYVTKLGFEQQGDVLRVTCHAVGKLPRGKTAKSTLTFSGPASERNALVQRVLEIVARGVVTRLAEMERIRRGDL
jgi:hypothetical protein